MSKRHSAKYKLDRRMGENIWGRPKSPINTRAARGPDGGWKTSLALMALVVAVIAAVAEQQDTCACRRGALPVG